jgi:hypothetical protein
LTVASLLVAANTGIMVFLTIAVAPTVFKVLPRDWAGAYVRAFFPKYYAFLSLTRLPHFARVLEGEPAW